MYPVNSCNLSTGTGLLVPEAAECIKKGWQAKEAAEHLAAVTSKCHASFILDALDFTYTGGRCRAVTALNANLLNLKPCIEVDSFHGGAMKVGKKYRGSLEKLLVNYTKEKLREPDTIKKTIFLLLIRELTAAISGWSALQ